METNLQNEAEANPLPGQSQSTHCIANLSRQRKSVAQGFELLPAAHIVPADVSMDVEVMMQPLNIGYQMLEGVQGGTNLEEVVPVELEEWCYSSRRLQDASNGIPIRIFLKPRNKPLPKFWS